MARKPKKPTTEAAYGQEELENERVFRDMLLYRYCQIVRLLPGDLIEVAPRAGHHLSVVYRVDSAGQRAVRIVLGPIAAAGKRDP
jgi:hypothetical protein